MPERIGEMLISKGLLTKEQLERALKLKLSKRKKLGEILIEEKYLTEAQVAEHLYSQLSERIASILKPMAEAEIKLSEFYALCAKADPSNKNFWLDVSADELRHAENLEEMTELARKKPHLLEEGHVFKEAAVKTFLRGLEIYVEKLKKNEMPSRNLLYIARDFEHTMLETKYADAIECEDAKFIAFLNTIRTQDAGHLVKFQDMIKALESKKKL